MNTLSILYLDDCDVRCKHFRSWFPNAKIVGTAQEAIDELNNNSYEIVFLDYDLGGEHTSYDVSNKNNGFVVAQHITAISRDKRPRVVIIHSHDVYAAQYIEKLLTNICETVIYAPFMSSLYRQILLNIALGEL